MKGTSGFLPLPLLSKTAIEDSKQTLFIHLSAIFLPENLQNHITDEKTNKLIRERAPLCRREAPQIRHLLGGLLSRP